MDDNKLWPIIKNSKIPFIVEFGADWCGPCHIVKPILEDIKFEYDGLINTMSIDVDQNKILITNLGIKFLPTIVIFFEGLEIHRFIGIVEKQTLRQHIDNLLVS